VLTFLNDFLDRPVEGSQAVLRAQKDLKAASLCQQNTIGSIIHRYFNSRYNLPRCPLMEAVLLFLAPYYSCRTSKWACTTQVNPKSRFLHMPMLRGNKEKQKDLYDELDPKTIEGGGFEE